MKRWWQYVMLAVVAVAGTVGATEDDPRPRIRMVTSLGEIVLELDREKAPQSVANFLSYVGAGFYDDTIFHRVISGFMVQGGGFTQGYERKATRAPVRNEADNGLRNVRGSVAMARTGDPHSATAQFFINLVDNAFLNHRAPRSGAWGYAVFGAVTEGMDTVDRIGAVATGADGPFSRDAPTTPVVIQKMTIE